MKKLSSRKKSKKNEKYFSFAILFLGPATKDFSQLQTPNFDLLSGILEK